MVGTERKSQGLRDWEVEGGRKEGHQVGPFIVLCPGVSLAGQGSPFFFLSFYLFYFIYLTVLGPCCSMWDLVPLAGIEPRASCVGSVES